MASQKTLDFEGLNNFAQVKGHAPICLLKRWTGFYWMIRFPGITGVRWVEVSVPHGSSFVLFHTCRHFGSSNIGGCPPQSLFRKMHSKRLVVLRPRFFPSPTRAFSAMPKESSILQLGKVENHLVMISESLPTILPLFMIIDEYIYIIYISYL